MNEPFTIAWLFTYNRTTRIISSKSTTKCYQIDFKNRYLAFQWLLFDSFQSGEKRPCTSEWAFYKEKVKTKWTRAENPTRDGVKVTFTTLERTRTDIESLQKPNLPWKIKITEFNKLTVALQLQKNKNEKAHGTHTILVATTGQRSPPRKRWLHTMISIWNSIYLLGTSSAAFSIS